MFSFVFYSQLTEDVVRGKQTYTRPVLARYFTNVKPGDQGWFGAPSKMTQDRADQIAAKIQFMVPDLVVETAQL